MTSAPLTASPVAAVEPLADVEPYVESWRVIAGAAGDADPVTDAVVRLRIGERRVIVSGEAANVDGALDNALRSALREMSPERPALESHDYERLRAQCGFTAVDDDVCNDHRLTVTAVHQPALLGRLAVLLNTHHITRFDYVVDAEGTHAQLTVQVRGDRWDVERVANRLRRVVGVTDVVESR